MAANLVESDFYPELYQLANKFINDRKVEWKIKYCTVDFLSHASPNLNDIIKDNVIKSSVISVHTKSRIHKKSGVFFLAETGDGFSESYFGNAKLCVQPHLVITKDHNLYFGDFLCFEGDTHYVTIVVSRRNSPEDNFCNDNLVKLDIHKNNFFRFEYSSGESAQQSFKMVYGSGLIVEILYMHDFEFEEDKIWTRNVKSNRRKQDLEHNKSCVHCNVNPS
ncbi:phytanoyl-CoA hydroxylase-interacting protein-like [Ditylenchus destructor]|nr:phytanoyl-CoA hydroxylase-interacting protein-like [Ditylenchus destructor]